MKDQKNPIKKRVRKRKRQCKREINSKKPNGTEMKKKNGKQKRMKRDLEVCRKLLF